MSQTIDVSGLSPEAVRIVEKVVTSLRVQEGQTAPPATTPAEAAARWRAAEEAVKGLTNYDFAAWEEQRALDSRHAQDHLE
jgi:hypothetical protein